MMVIRLTGIREDNKHSNGIGAFKEDRNVNEIIHVPRKGIGRIIM